MKLAAILYRWAIGKPERLCKLKEALSKSINEIIDNKGKELTSANISDASFTIDPTNSLTSEQWAAILQDAIDQIESGGPYTSRRSCRVTY